MAGESRKLTAKQRTFVAVYAGNGTQAARLAGYAGSDDVLAQVAAENLRKPHIAAAIEARQAEEAEPLIMRRLELQRWWSAIMCDEEISMGARLRASELLARSQGDFIERLIIERQHSSNPYAVMTDEELEAEIERLLPGAKKLIQ